MPPRDTTRTFDTRCEVGTQQVATVVIDLPAECAGADEVVVTLRGTGNGRGSTRTLRIPYYVVRRMFPEHVEEY